MPRPEGESPPIAPYHKEARFQQELHAADAFKQSQDAIFASEEELSAFRIFLDAHYWVAVLGDPPADEMNTKVEGILYQHGIKDDLPEEILEALTARRKQLHVIAPKVEGHYRPGQPMWV